MPTRRDLAVTALLLVVLFAVFFAFLHLGDPVAGDDYCTHACNAHDFGEALAEGVLVPRWAQSSFGGLGAPTFYFYPPLSYYLAAAGAALGGHAEIGFHLAAIAASLFGSLSLYVLLRRRTGTTAAAVAALLWALLPYGVLCFYLRFAWAEFCALAWLPFVFLAASDQVERPGRSATLRLILGFAGLAATHLLTAMTFCPLVTAYVLFEAARRRSAALCGRFAVAAGLAILVAAGFLLPVVLDQHLIRLDHTRAIDFGRIGQNFVLHDATTAGYESTNARPLFDIAAVAQLLVALGAALTLRFQGRLNGRAGFLLGASLLLFYLMTALSEPWWRFVPLLDRQQFPWRLLGSQALLAAWLAGLAIDALLSTRKSPARAIPVVATVAVWFAVTAAGVWTAHPASRDPRMPRRPENPHTSGLLLMEYLPRGVSPALVYGFRASLIHPFVVTEGDVDVDVKRLTPHRQTMALDAGDGKNTLILRTFRYPGWTVRLDGREVETVTVPRLGTIALDVPPGRHTLEVVNQPTFSRRLGLWLSLAGLLLSALYLWRLRASAPPPPRRFTVSRGRAAAALVAATLLLAALPVAFPFPRARPNLVIITARNLRADQAQFNGHPGPTSARIDHDLVPDAIRFRRAYTPATDPADSAAALFAASGLVQRLGAAGYEIGAILGEDLPARQPALERIFPHALRPTGPGKSTPNAAVFAQTRDWLEARKRDPFLLWVHLADTAERVWLPPDAAGDDLQAVQRRYHDALAGTDAVVGQILDVLALNAGYAKSVVAVAGIGAAEPTVRSLGGAAAAGPLSEAATAVWLVVKFTGGAPRGTAVESTPVSVADLAPTLLDLIGIDRGAATAGRNLLDVALADAARSAPSPGPVEIRRSEGPGRALVFPGFKILRDESARPSLLEVLPQPPWERPWKGPPPEAARRHGL